MRHRFSADVDLRANGGYFLVLSVCPCWHATAAALSLPACVELSVMTCMVRLRWVAVCLLLVCMAAPQASGQFLGQDILDATSFDAAKREKMRSIVAPAMDVLTAQEPDPQAVSKARADLVRPLTQPSSAEFRSAFSGLITPKMKQMVVHESALIRINAMIILGYMTDGDSSPLIEAVLKNDQESVAVKRKAIEALQRRVQAWLRASESDRVKSALTQAVAVLDQAPHASMVGPALELLLTINSDGSKKALVDQLNKRIGLHAADPKLLSHGEQSVLNQLGLWLQTPQPDTKSLRAGVNRAAYRFALLSVTQLGQGKLDPKAQKATAMMLAQCIETMARVSAGDGKGITQGPDQIKELIRNSDWPGVEAVLKNGWAPILKAQPYVLRAEDLKVSVN